MDGAILADALLDPTAAEVAAQSADAGALAAYQDALKEQTARDIRWYGRKHIEVPPAARPHP
jgi:hypothetical protein